MATLDGTNGRDSLRGTGGDDLIRLAGGPDLGFGVAGSDTIFGGSGDDGIYGGSGGDLLDGGAGNDLVDGGSGNDDLRGGWGDDLVLGGGGDDLLYGSLGRDRLEGGDGRDRLWGGDDDDRLRGRAGNDRLDGGTGNDLLSGGDGDDTLVATVGHDSLVGEAGNDLFLFQGSYGDEVNVIARGGIGDDVMRIGDSWGNDARYVHGSLLGDAGDDTITVGLYVENVRLFGGSGNDVISAPGGQYGAADVFGGDGDDTLSGAFVRGGNGDDAIRATDGGYAYGEAGDDVIYGGEEVYRTYSGAVIYGGAGDDLVLGGGPDSVHGGLGNDAIRGGDVWGDAGNDTFHFHGAHHGFYGSDDRFEDGFSTVHDFQAGESISLKGAQMITGYDASYQAILAPVTLDDLTFSRGGGTLFVSTVEHPDGSGEYSSRSVMTVRDFFERGLSSIKVDGVVVDLSDLASG